MSEKRILDDLDPALVRLRKEQQEQEIRAAALLDRQLFELSLKRGRQRPVKIGRN